LEELPQPLVSFTLTGSSRADKTVYLTHLAGTRYFIWSGKIGKKKIGERERGERFFFFCLALRDVFFHLLACLVGVNNWKRETRQSKETTSKQTCTLDRRVKDNFLSMDPPDN
jgi:hypothetical protein